MKILNLKQTLAVTAALVGLSVGSSALAQNTAAGTDITNMATLTFTAGGGNITLNSTEAGNSDIVGGGGPNAAGSDTVFEVDRIIDFSVTNLGADWNDGGFASIGQNDVIVAFDITNTSNATLDFDLVAVVDNADITVQPSGFSAETNATTTWASGITPTIFVDDPTSANSTYNVGVDVDDFVDELAPAATRRIYVLLNIPATAIQDESAPVSIVAQVAGNTDGTGAYIASDNLLGSLIVADSNGQNSPGSAGATSVVDATNLIQNVFAEDVNAQADEEGTVDSTAFIAANFDASGTAVINDGQFGATSGILINGASLSLSKTVETIWDPVNGRDNPKAIPGAYVRYILEITNTGGATANLDDVADQIAAELDFDTGLLGLGACTDIETTPTAPGSCDSYNTGLLSASTTQYAIILDIDSDITPAGILFDYAGAAEADNTFFSTSGFVDPNLTVDLTLLDVTVIGGDYAGGSNGDLQATDTVYIIYNAIIQ